MKVPPKVRIFLWRACHEILPTRIALMRRQVGTDPYCASCETTIETESHAFSLVLFSVLLGGRNLFSLELQAAIPNFAAGICLLKEKLEVELACVVLWNIWNFRNEMLHGSANGDRGLLVVRSKEFLNSFRSARFHFSVESAHLPTADWQAPRDSVIKVNFDAALFKSGTFQVAAVALDADGVCRGWSIRKFLGLPSPVIAEACAARHAILLARDKCWTYIHVEGDCLHVVNAINDRSGDGLCNFGTIISACVGLSSLFEHFHCYFIRRMVNRLAHELAHFSFPDGFVLDGVLLPAALAHLI